MMHRGLVGKKYLKKLSRGCDKASGKQGEFKMDKLFVYIYWVLFDSVCNYNTTVVIAKNRKDADRFLKTWIQEQEKRMGKSVGKPIMFIKKHLSEGVVVG